jgi:glycosyltransferase involved in cell wall biosynthesis
MRILVAHLVGSARTGGMSRLMGRVHDQLAATGHEVHYLTADHVDAGVNSRLGRFRFQWLVRRAAIDAARRGEAFDIINVHEPHAAAVSLFRRGLERSAIVAMTHGVERRGWEVALRHPPSRPSLQTRVSYPISTLWLSRQALRHADHVICLNTMDREFLTRRFGIPGSNITPITPGADPVFGDAAAGRTYASGGRLLFAGTWIPRKGVKELSQAFDRLIERGVDLRLDIIGGGASETEIRRDFSAAAAGRVRVLTGGGDAEMARAMATADVFVLPSLFEGTPLTLVEAMWSGLPVVTTATAGMRDVVIQDRTGLLVPPADSAALEQVLERIAGDAGLRRTLGTAAHRVAAERYTWEHAAASVEAAYRAARRHHG